MFELYKPLRNRVRQYWMLEGLEVVYRFIQWIEIDRKLPKALSHPHITSGKSWIRTGVLPWEFELLARELILNASKFPTKKSLASWAEVAKNINEIKDIENKIWPLCSDRDNDVLYELVRVAHRQFPWQRGVSRSHFAAYVKLYDTSPLKELFQREYGMSSKEMIELAMALSGHFLNSFAIRLPIRNELNGVDQETCDRFVDRFMMTVEEARSKIAADQQYNINWAYTFNPLRSKPLLRVNEDFAVCPIPGFLLRRATSEVYFDLVKHDDEFSRSFGPAFQSVVGDVARELVEGSTISILHEERYGSKSKPRDTVDWILVDESGSLFVECKASRIRYRGISDLTDHAFMDAEFGRVRKFCLQVYKTLSDALNSEYPHWKPDGRPVFPLIVTLEEWETFGIHVVDQIIDPLRKELGGMGIDPGLVDRHPPTFCSLSTFDNAVFLSSKLSINDVFKGKIDGENLQWAMDTYLAQTFPDELAAREGLTLAKHWEVLGKRGQPAGTLG